MNPEVYYFLLLYLVGSLEAEEPNIVTENIGPEGDEEPNLVTESIKTENEIVNQSDEGMLYIQLVVVM